jgi:CheY-like chemotaxis protein
VVILALTASATRSDEEKALQAGCNGYVAKPIDGASFPSVIAKYLPHPATP